MEKERKIKTLTVIALVLLVLGLTVAFAALSQTLTINGSANVDAASWNVQFDPESFAMDYPGDKVEKPEVTGTSITGFKAYLRKPGNSFRIWVNLVNSGTIDARLDSIVKNERPICTSLTGDEEDAQMVCDNLKVISFLMSQEEMEEIAPNFDSEEEMFEYIIENGYSLKEGDVIKAGETQLFTYIVYYDAKTSNTPDDNVSITGLDLTLNYVQN